MGSLARKMRRKKQLRQVKAAKKKLNAALSVSQKMPGECSSCATVFDREAEGALDDWRIVDNGSGVVSLYCDECWGNV